MYGNTYTVNSNENAKVQNSETNDNVILDFYIPQGFDGVKGEKGDIGPNLIEIAYIATFIDTFTGNGMKLKKWKIATY